MAFVAWSTAGANSYISVADADSYFALRLNVAAWTSAVNATKEAALVTATRSIDAVKWNGEKTVVDQDLAFPRTGLTDIDGEELADDAIPQEVLDATCELALAMLVNSAVITAADSGSNIRRVAAGSASVEYFRPVEGTSFPALVQKLLIHLLGGAGTSGFGVSGSDYCPVTTDRGLTEPYS